MKRVEIIESLGEHADSIVDQGVGGEQVVLFTYNRIIRYYKIQNVIIFVLPVPELGNFLRYCCTGQDSGSISRKPVMLTLWWT